MAHPRLIRIAQRVFLHRLAQAVTAANDQSDDVPWHQGGGSPLLFGGNVHECSFLRGTPWPEEWLYGHRYARERVINPRLMPQRQRILWL